MRFCRRFKNHFPRVMRFGFWRSHSRYTLVFFFFFVGSSLAYSAPSQEDDEAPSSQFPISAASDAAIETRLRSILENIGDFKNVKVTVNDGVVRLSGTTSRRDASEKVSQMISRFEGVIYVDNQIEVESDVETRVKPALSRAKQYLRNVIQKLPIIGVALAVLVSFWLIGRLVTHWDLPYQRLGLNRLLRNLIRQFLRKGIFLLGVLFAFDILDLTALAGAVLGTVGVLGLAIGFAFKDIIENYLAGVLLSIRRPFDLNDLVLIESHEGRVLRLTPSELILMTLEGNHVRIPNATVFKSFVYNYSINPRRRFDFGVGVGVNEDLLDVQAYGCRALEEMEGVMAEPAPFMIVEDLGDYNVLVRFFGWVDQRDADFLKVRGEAIRRVKTALEDADVEMPEPAQTIRMAASGKEEPSAQTLKPAHAGDEKRKAKAVDISRDTQLDNQINEDLSAAHEPNLLTEN